MTAANPPGRSFWKGNVAFGLVVFPVSLYTATDTHDISFRQVHRKDGGRIRQRRVCSADGQEVPYSDIAKGFENPDGSITVLSDDDMESLPLPTRKTIQVEQFTDPRGIDPLLRSKSYYVWPGQAAGTAYALLAAALAKTGMAGVAKVTLRQRESVALLREAGGLLILDLLLWPDEVRQAEAPEKPELNPAYTEQAMQLIGAMTAEFRPEDYTDRYTEALTAVIEAKTAGGGLRASAGPAGIPAAAPADLGNVLRASIAAAKTAREEREAA